MNKVRLNKSQAIWLTDFFMIWMSEWISKFYKSLKEKHWENALIVPNIVYRK